MSSYPNSASSFNSPYASSSTPSTGSGAPPSGGYGGFRGSSSSSDYSFGDTSQYESGRYEYNSPGGGYGGYGGFGGLRDADEYDNNGNGGSSGGGSSGGGSSGGGSGGYGGFGGGAGRGGLVGLGGAVSVPTAGVGDYTDVDPRDLDPLAGLYPSGAGQVELVNPEDAERGWGRKVMHQTAMAWVGGTAVGVPWGALEGLRQAPGSSAKLLVNSALNGVTRRGPPLGNTLAAVALMYNCIEGGINLVSPTENHTLNGLAAGVASGLIYKSTAGARRMLVGGIGGGILAGSFLLADYVAENGLSFPALPSLDALVAPLKDLVS